MNLYPDLRDDEAPTCPAPDCGSTDVEQIATRPDGLPQWGCRECATWFSDPRPPAEA